jgi:hypothetical protein
VSDILDSQGRVVPVEALRRSSVHTWRMIRNTSVRVGDDAWASVTTYLAPVQVDGEHREVITAGVLGGDHDGETWHYASIEEARADHARIVALVSGGAA